MELLKRSELADALIHREAQISPDQGAIEVALVGRNHRIESGPGSEPDLELEIGGVGEPLQGGEVGGGVAGLEPGDGGLGGSGPPGQLFLGKAGLAAQDGNQRC